jgi:hypothetical protein
MSVNILSSLADVISQAERATKCLRRAAREAGKDERDCRTIVNSLLEAQGAVEAALAAYLTD